MPARFLAEPGPRPPFSDLAEYLWGKGVDFDSDGNSTFPQDGSWTELTIQRRPDYLERVDIDPVSVHPLVLKVYSSSEDMVERVVRFLEQSCGGSVLTNWKADGNR